MKLRIYLFVLVTGILMALSSVGSTLAQEPLDEKKMGSTPPTGEQVKPPPPLTEDGDQIPSMQPEESASSTMFGSGSQPPGGGEKEASASTGTEGDLAAAEVRPISSKFPIPLDTTAQEESPAIALCASDEYLVVYAKDGDIYGQRLTNQGALLGDPFIIYDPPNTASQPDVACDWYRNRFVVVWTYDYNGDGSDLDVRTQSVYGQHQPSGSQLEGDDTYVSWDTGVDEYSPAIACNSDDGQCLVVFEYGGSGSGDILAQRLSAAGAAVSRVGDRFDVGVFSAEEHNPDVAWGGFDNNFLVVWEYLHDSPSNHYRILFSHVYDTEQGNGLDEREHSGAFLINTGEGYLQDQLVPVVAYNHQEQTYLAVFQHDYLGDYDIRARRVVGVGKSEVVGDTFFVRALEAVSEVVPAVAFSDGRQSIPGGLGSNQFMVIYRVNDVLYGRGVMGAYKASGSQLEGPPSALAIASSPYDLTNNSDVTGSINNGQYLAVWEEYYQFGSNNYNIWGVMAEPFDPYETYIPIVRK